MAIQHRVEAAEDDSEWKIIAAMVAKMAKDKKSKVKDKGKRVLAVADKLPAKNPTVHEIEVDGTRYAIVRIVTLG